MGHQVRTVVVAFALCTLHSALVFGQLSVLQSRHYRIHTDVDREFVEELAARMDSMYDEYERRLASFAPPDADVQFEVYIFARQADYLALVGAEYLHSGGVFMPGRNLLAVFLQTHGRDELRRVLQHEAFHQFAHKVIHPELPSWLNEGTAELFEEGIWNGERFWLGQVPPHRVRQLQADMKARRLVDFATFMRQNNEEWTTHLLQGGEQRGATLYTQAWAMVHFLAFDDRDGDGTPDYRQRFVQMLRLLHEGRDAEAAFAEAFGGNVRGFQDRFVEFARRLKPTPVATLIEHQDILADLLSELSAQGRTFVKMEDFRKELSTGRYRLNYIAGDIRWRTEDDASVYFRDLQGRALLSSQFYFDRRPGAPLPDMVRRMSDDMQLRTRFYRVDQRIEHEVLVEPP